MKKYILSILILGLVTINSYSQTSIVKEITGLLKLTFVSDDVIPIGAQIRLAPNGKVTSTADETLIPIGTAKTAAIIGQNIDVTTNFSRVIKNVSESALQAGTPVMVNEIAENNDCNFAPVVTGKICVGIVTKTFVAYPPDVFQGEIGLFCNPFRY